jgi:hypothetical protein
VTRLLCFLVGALYFLTGVAMLLAPMWFFDNIATFPPFNRHFLGDLGSFSIAIGTGLLLAVWDARYLRGAVAVGLVASGLHLLNHGFDAVVGSVPERGWSDVPGLALVLVLLVAPLWATLRPSLNRRYRR